MESMGEGSARCIRLTILFVLALSGIILQGLVYYYGLQATEREWGTLGIQVWALVIITWILTVGMGMALLWKRLKHMLEGANLDRRSRFSLAGNEPSARDSIRQRPPELEEIERRHH